MGNQLEEGHFDGEELLVLARLDLQKSAVEPALQKLKRAVLRPDAPPEVQLELGRLYAQLGLRHKAEPLFVSYLSAKPDDIDATFQLGMLRFEGGQTASAQEAWQKVLNTSPQYPPARFYTALASAQAGQTADARRMLRALMDEVPTDNLYFARARDLLSSLDTAERSAAAPAMDLAQAYPTQH